MEWYVRSTAFIDRQNSNATRMFGRRVHAAPVPAKTPGLNGRSPSFADEKVCIACLMVKQKLFHQIDQIVGAPTIGGGEQFALPVALPFGPALHGADAAGEIDGQFAVDVGERFHPRR